MTRLEVALLFVAVWEAGVIGALAWRIHQLEAEAASRRRREIDWAANYIRNRYADPVIEPAYWQGGTWGPGEVWQRPAGRGGGKTSAGLNLHRQLAEALGVRIHDDQTVSEVIDVHPPPRPHLEEGMTVSVQRFGEESPRWYQVERAIGDQVRLKRVDGD